VLTARIQLAAAYKFDQSSEFEFRVGMNSRHTNDEDTQVTLAGNNFTYSSVGDDSVSGGFAGINLRVADSGNLSFVADAEVGGNNNENYIAGNLSLEYSF
jgi:Ethanolamine utilization protein EutJ (predicted chaperonin)